MQHEKRDLEEKLCSLKEEVRALLQTKDQICSEIQCNKEKLSELEVELEHQNHIKTQNKTTMKVHQKQQRKLKNDILQLEATITREKAQLLSGSAYQEIEDTVNALESLLKTVPFSSLCECTVITDLESTELLSGS
tara:strand:- start:214 stop:621 length:408 start_codon:yes stop_codon:yes gene_type:complete